MDIREASERDRDSWNTFVAAHPEGSFLQSWEWGAFQKSLGNRVTPLRMTDGVKLAGVALVLHSPLPLDKEYLYIPRGPVLRDSSREERKKLLNLIVSHISQRIAGSNTVFLRMDPEWEDDVQKREFLRSCGFTIAPKEMQPQYTSILHLGKTDEEFFENMKPKTRYNIRVAQRKGVEILHCPSAPQNSRASEEFWKLLQETASRDDFCTHTKEHYKKLIQNGFANPVGQNHPNFEFLVAKYQNKMVAANIVVYFGKRATYLHGASSHKYRSLMATYLLQWEAIQEARRRGCTEYDFWGVSAPATIMHKLAGISRFKRGFGGVDIAYVGSWDMAFHKYWYLLYRFGRYVLSNP